MILEGAIQWFDPPRRWAFDVALFTFVIAGTVGHAQSFSATGFGEGVDEVARGIGWAAGVSWVGLGGVLALMDRSPGGILNWFRLCLRTMGVGMVVLSSSTMANWVAGEFTSGWLLGFHLGVLMAADGIMCWVFVRGAKRLSVGPVVSIGLWVVVLNGLFAGFLVWLL